MARLKLSALKPVAAILLLVGCGVGAATAPGSVEEVAAALQANGLANAQTAPADLPPMRYAQIDGATALVGDGLHVEIVKITDERTWKAYLGMAMAFGGAKRSMLDMVRPEGTEAAAPPPAAEAIPHVFSQQPYIVVVREEPREGTVKAAFDDVFGG